MIVETQKCLPAIQGESRDNTVYTPFMVKRAPTKWKLRILDNDRPTDGQRGTMQKRILIAEPNRYLSEMQIRLLTAFGYEVVGATADVTAIVDLLRGSAPDLLLIDYGMSQQMDIAAARAQFPDLKVAASVLHEAIDGFAEVARRAGLDGYFSKYASQAKLLQTIDTLLA